MLLANKYNGTSFGMTQFSRKMVGISVAAVLAVRIALGTFLNALLVCFLHCQELLQFWQLFCPLFLFVLIHHEHVTFAYLQM